MTGQRFSSLWFSPLYSLFWWSLANSLQKLSIVSFSEATLSVFLKYATPNMTPEINIFKRRDLATFFIHPEGIIFYQIVKLFLSIKSIIQNTINHLTALEPSEWSPKLLQTISFRTLYSPPPPDPQNCPSKLWLTCIFTQLKNNKGTSGGPSTVLCGITKIDLRKASFPQCYALVSREHMLENSCRRSSQC